MKKASYERIIKAYENASTLLGFPTLNSGLRYMRGELEKTLGMLKRVRNGSDLESCLAKEPEVSTEQLDATVKMIELLPYRIRRILPDAVKEARKHLPHEPGGRPHALDPKEHRKVCYEIGQLIAEGVLLKIEQQRIAQRRAVSLRTIQRVWQKRKATAAVSQPEAGGALKP